MPEDTANKSIPWYESKLDYWSVRLLWWCYSM